MRTVRVVRGLFAAGVLIALLVGPPWALWLVGQPFLPGKVPTLDDVAAALLRPDDGTLLIGLLVLVGWAVWTALLISIVAEVLDRIRSGGRTARRRERWTLRPSRAVAALLVGWIVTMFVSTPASGATPRATVTDLVPQAVTNPRLAADSGRVHVVVARDTLWDIAAEELGDALRWREILDINRGRAQPDGGRLTDDAVLHVGWTLALPGPPPPDGEQIEVHPGDTLSELAGRYLGDPDRYDELYADNAGVRQRDGRTLQDANVIRPGWLLRLPGATDGAVPGGGPAPDTGSAPATVTPDPGPTPAGPPNPSRPGPAPAASPTRPAPPTTTSPRPSAPPSTAAPPTTTGPSTTSAPATSRTTSGPSGTPSSASAPASSAPTVIPGPSPSGAPGPVVPGEVTTWPLPVAPTVGIAGVLASALLANLFLLRRRQQQSRRYGRRIALPGAALSGVEAAVALSAQPAGPLFLDLVLRCIAAAAPPRYPALRAARLCSTGVELVLAAPQPPPAPFQEGREDGSTWEVSHEARLPLTEATAVGVANPYPALVSLGRDENGATFLLDLELAGAVHLVGDPARAVDLLRHLAVELGTARSADAVTVLTVGLEPDLARLPARRVREAADLTEAIAHVRDARRTATDDLRRADGALLNLRVQDQLSETWLVTVLLVVHTAGLDIMELSALCADLFGGERSTVAVVTAASPTELDGVTVHIDPDGRATVSGFDDEDLQVEQMPEPLARGVVAVLDTATAPDQPVRRANDPDPWADDMNEDGTWRRPPAASSDDDEAEPPPASPEPPAPEPSGATLVNHKPLDGGSAGGEPVHSEPADPVAQRRLLLVEQQDPQLDDDLALWTANAVPARPLIGILGPPQLRSPGQPPEKRHSWYLEVVLYLALHPHGVDRDKLMTDLWPEGVAIQPPTIRRAIAEARAWAGKDTTSDPPTDFIPAISPAGGDRYRITGHLTDWDLFRRLRKRAQARAAAHRHASAIADYTAALQLIRGPVLHPLRSRGYAWLHNPDQRHADLIPGFVIDTAHELVDLALAEGDVDLARFAATTAQTVDPDRTSDRPFTDLMRIAHATGDLDEMRTHAELLLAERDFEVGEELPPESFAVFDELFPHGLRTRAS